MRSEASDPMLPLGTNRCKCAGCGRYFSTVANFERHQRISDDGRPVCRDPESVGMVLGDSGHWQQPGNPDMPRFTETKRRHATEEGGLVSAVVSTQETLF